MSVPWDPDFASRSPIFEPLRAAAGGLRAPGWPAIDDLNRLLAAQGGAPANANGIPLRFVAQQARQRAFAEKFEPRIFLRGEIQVRSGNWHDLCNALVWLTFPRIKAALNERQFRALGQQRASGLPNRGPAQDALTLYDEGGVIIVTADREAGRLLSGRLWKTLFWHQRAAVAQSMRFFIFGHALYEKALQPFIGVSGRAWIAGVAREFLAMPLADQLCELDRQVAACVADPARFLRPSELTPLPILGVPGWCADNERAEFYDNIDYFRPPRKAAPDAAAPTC